MSRGRSKQRGQMRAPLPSIVDQSPALKPERLQSARAFQSRTENLDHHPVNSDGSEGNTTGAEEEKKQNLRYCDYYCFMSLKDFTAWAERNDGSEPSISYSAAESATGVAF